MKLPSFFVLSLISFYAPAEEAWLQRSLDILEAAMKQDQAAFLTQPTAEQVDIVKSIRDEARDQTLAHITQPEQESHAPDNGVLYFASFSMPEADLRNLFIKASANDNAQVVFRGMMEGKNLTGTFAAIKAMIKGLEPPPNISIDPTVFSEFQVSVAPTLYAFINGKPVAHARGITAANWIFRKIADGKTGDLGKYGTTYAIAEKNLLDEMKARLAQLDFDAMREHMIATYWDKYTFIRLTPAERDAVYELDPSIHVKQAITTPDGTVIAKAGQIVNPLQRLPFTKKIVVFNPTRNNEMAYVKSLQSTASEAGYGLILIATQIDRAKGWQGLNEIQAHFYAPLYMLNNQLQQRFNFRHTPTTVHAEHNRFIITEKYLGHL